MVFYTTFVEDLDPQTNYPVGWCIFRRTEGEPLKICRALNRKVAEETAFELNRWLK